MFFVFYRCSSSVGKQGGQQFVNFGIGCKRIGTILHEMMHSIGIIHEQSRPDRNKYIDVRYDNIKPSETIFLIKIIVYF